MKAITCLIGLFLLFLASSAKAQSDGDEIPWSINSGTMVGIGSYNLMDTYLSPSMEDKKYTGPGLRVMNERMKRVRLANSLTGSPQGNGIYPKRVHRTSLFHRAELSPTVTRLYRCPTLALLSG